MPAKKQSTTNGKRKAASSPEPKTSGNGSSKKPRTASEDGEPNSYVLREYYPAEMSNARAAAYNNNEIPRPIEVLNDALKETAEERERIEGGKTVVHWFKCDLRVKDNRALWMAGEKAKEIKGGVVGIPSDFEAHVTAPVRVDFILRTLEVLKSDLAKLDIPLHVETVEKRKRIPDRIFELMKEWNANHLFANVEYEVDELRREAKMVRTGLGKGIAIDVVHDTCVVAPGKLSSGTGKQYSVYSPWFRAWVAHIHQNPELLDAFDEPGRNPPSSRKDFQQVFASSIPEAPSNKTLTEDEKQRFKSLWPPGESEAHARLEKFCNEKIGSYSERRNFPADAATSSLSVHLSSGTLSARTAVRRARDFNKTKKLDGGSEGIKVWIILFIFSFLQVLLLSIFIFIYNKYI
ncbi:hypothetical protein B7494_g31 [Chlorociboria aeruginascens]|nr:hypothetical protein B7494_g31 [Chlorociboria aeruginascens]